MTSVIWFKRDLKRKPSVFYNATAAVKDPVSIAAQRLAKTGPSGIHSWIFLSDPETAVIDSPQRYHTPDGHPPWH